MFLENKSMQETRGIGPYIMAWLSNSHLMCMYQTENPVKVEVEHLHLDGYFQD